MSRKRSRRTRYLRHTRKQERGNFLVTTALLLTVLIGMIALVVDIGFAAGQRRFMQNGADAAALAAADLMSGSVSPYPVNGPWPHGIPNFFNVSDATVRAKAVSIATQNQNPGLAGRTTSFSVDVDYCVAVNDSSFAPQTPGCPSPNSWVASPTADGRVPDGTYKVRVTVNSTVSTIFGGMIGKTSTNSVGQGIAVILGVCPQLTATGDVLPLTIWDQQDFGADPNQLFQLWSSNPPAPKNADSNWKNVIDLSPSAAWCDGKPSDYQWVANPSFAGMVPVGTNCTPVPGDPTQNFSGSDNTWNRDLYAPDLRAPACLGTSTNPDDVYMWTSALFGGTLAVGMKVPTYPHLGDNGQNIADAIWGTTPNVCTNTYFFQGITAIDPAHPDWGPYRDVKVFTYDVLNTYGNHFYRINGSKNSGWIDSQNQSATMGRVTLVRILNVRIFRDAPHTSSGVEALVVSEGLPPGYNPGNCPSFGSMGPGIYGNVVRLGA